MDSDKHSFLYKQKISKKLQKLLYKELETNPISNNKITYINKKGNNIKTHLDTDQNKNKQNSVIPKNEVEKSLIQIKKSFKTLKNSFNSNVDENSNIYLHIREMKEVKENIPFNLLCKGLLSSKSKKMNKNNIKYENRKIIYHNNSCIKKNNMKSFQNCNNPNSDGVATCKQICLGTKIKSILNNLSSSKNKYKKNESNKKKQSFGISSNEISNNLLKMFNNNSNKSNLHLNNYYSQKNNSDCNNYFFKTNSNLKSSINNFNEDNIFDYNDEKQAELTKEEKALYGDRIMKGYSKVKLLGKGGYGIVWLCQKNNDKYNAKEYAIKQTSKKKTQEFTHNLNNTLSNARNEIAILCLLNNKNNESDNEINDSNDIDNNFGYELIPKIYDAYEDNNDIWFSFEKGGNSLSSLCFKIKGEFEKGERIYLIQKGKFLVSLFSNICQFKYLLKQLILGINYINSKGIIHSDIKPENILIDYIIKDDYFKIISIKIIDYGSSFFYNQISSSNSSNTPEYLCPEITVGNKKFIKDLSNSDKYVNAVDVWSIGITLLELCLSCPIWMNFKTKITINRKIIYTHGIFGCRMREANKIHQKQIEISKNLDKLLKNSLLYMFEKEDRINFIDLLGKMLNIDYAKRINASEILKHPFLNETL
jgi:dual specificity tyrosine-phosphorylation-regulated kinase 2/3/4